MKRMKLTVAYDGSEYSGWQIQPNAPTIEAALDEAVRRLTGETLHVTGASRTDAGVHALGNIAVLDTESAIPGARWSYALNRFLPEDIRVIESRQVRPDFHPRHCRTVKTYEYRILNAPYPIPQLRRYSWHVPGALDLGRMQSAAQKLVGEHDFKSFCCVRTQAESTVRTVYSISVSAQPFVTGALAAIQPSGALITVRVSGNGFLYNMVRIIAGTLVEAGKGRLTADGVAQMLAAKDRCRAGQTAPPQGLTLMDIQYVDGEDAVYSAGG